MFLTEELRTIKEEKSQLKEELNAVKKGKADTEEKLKQNILAADESEWGQRF
jgi:predicted  nucleic acid-binding Zn-ribbon protein